jgi:hypothetical protein
VAGVAVRNERWRYAEWDGGQGGAVLFDHANDPHELKNLANDPSHTRIKSELSALAKRHAAGARP